MSNNYNRLDGQNPLAYLGVNSYSPPNLITNVISPTPTDSQNFPIGSFWINTDTEQAYILVNLDKGDATWVEFTSGTGGSVVQFTTDDGHHVTPLAGNVDISGSININTTGTIGPDVVTINLNDSIILPTTSADGSMGVIYIGGAGTWFLQGFGTANTFVGDVAGNFVLTGTDNTGAGAEALHGLRSGNQNSSLGSASLQLCSSGSDNTSAGYFSLGNLTTASQSSAFGSTALAASNASNNSAFGFSSQASNTSGTFNSSFGALSLALNLVGTDNSAFGYNSLHATTGSLNSAFGSGALRTNTGSGNCAFGYLASSGNGGGVRNCAYGVLSVTSNTSATDISAYGFNSLAATTGSFNTAVGSNALITVLSGTGNLALGYASGSSYTGAESNNILIGAAQTGVVGEDDVIRIGVLGTQTLCFIAGIFGVNVSVGSGTAVFIDNTGNLGTAVSSIKFKENIERVDIGDKLYSLNPVKFNYKSAEDKSQKSYGLIAEEVMNDFPELVTFDNYHEPYSVKYHELPILLLAEIQKLNERIKALESRINSQ